MGKIISNIISLCFIIEIFLILLDIFIGSGHVIYISLDSVRNICNMTYECSFANFASSLESFFVGIIVIIIFFILRLDKADKRRISVWFLTGIFFIYMGIDDGVAIHERVGDTFRDMCKYHSIPFLSNISNAFPSYQWQLIMGPFFIIIFFYILYFLWYELKGLSLKRYIFIAILCFGNALFLDYMHGAEQCVLLLQSKTGLSYDLTRHCIKLAGESLELLGIIYFFYVFLKYLAHILDNKRFFLRN